MRKLLFVSETALVIAVSALIGGCNSDQGLVTGGATSSTIDQIRTATVDACKYLPKEGTVKKIIDAMAIGTPGVSSALTVATAICDAVAPPPGAVRSPGPPTVNGVVLEGHFVR